MLHGCQKKILPIALSLVLMLNLILIPKIDVSAVGYIGDFHYTYNGVNFYFDFLNEFPANFTIDESVFRSVINSEMSMDTIRIASDGYIISSQSTYVSDIFSLIVNAALQLSDSTAFLSYIDHTLCIKFDVTYIGYIDGHYIFSFSCPFGTQDIRLNDSGYIPSPSDHTYTTHVNSLISDALQDQIDGDNIYLLNPIVSINNIRSPYFVGTTLHIPLYLLNDNNLHEYVVTNAYETQILTEYVSGPQYYRIGFGNDHINSTQVLFDGAVPGNLGTSNNYTVVYNGQSHTFKAGTTGQYIYNANLPSFNTNLLNVPSFNSNILMAPTQGISNGQYVVATTNAIWLARSKVNPVENPTDIVIPYENPVPVDPIIGWPDDNLPVEDPTGDPEPVEPFEPVIPPVPFPVPPLPPLVSGNDDLWPDMNGVFEVESEIDGFLGGLSNFEFTPLRTLVEGFSSSLIWVSTIMMALYNGSDFSILFVVLSIFFIAAALLGIYKWWTH